MGQAQLSNQTYLWQNTQNIDALLGHVFEIAESHTKTFNISLGACKSINGKTQYSAMVACLDKSGTPHTCVTTQATTPSEMVLEVEQFLKRL